MDNSRVVLIAIFSDYFILIIQANTDNYKFRIKWLDTSKNY